MKKTKITSLLLCLALFFTLIVPGTAVYAEGEPDNGMKISKTATANPDGSYTITLEAFATGAQTTTTVSEDVPTDIILVLDQSGSMADDIGQVQYRAYTGNDTQNKSNYERRHNGGSVNLWQKLDDGSFVSVSVTLQQAITYNKITKGRNDNSSDGYTNYWDNRNNLYTYVNGEIKKVVYTRDREYFWKNWSCEYALEDGTILNQNNDGSKHSPTFQNTDDGFLYLGVENENQNVYTYTYTDSTGATQTIGTSIGANTKFAPAFYQRRTTTSGGGSRLNALKSAANAFANAVAEKAAGADGDINTTADNVNHRIAVVGFACGQYYNYTNYDFRNTEVFVGGSQYTYGTAAQGQYGNAFQNMNTSTGVSNVSASIGALSANGGTLINLGLEMGNGIFGANPIANGQKRNRVVIVFSDGVPGWNGYDSDIANSAFTQAETAKNTYGATVYSIGIFSGADATSAGNQNGNETEKANWFMQQVSSNNGKPRYPSYYLSAGDAGTLDSIFQQISNNITTGGSSTTLGRETVIKDIISPYFTLPTGTTASDIQINTYNCIGKNGNTYEWSSTSGGNDGATATVNGDQVSVTGFDFSENWCGTETNAQGTTVRGKKLVISFTVDPKSGFLGGNDVITNADAGIYENSSAQTPILRFEQPKVNVPIGDVTVTAGEKNVYLLGDVTAEELKAGATVTVGGVTLDLSKANDAERPYGLEKWQTEFVSITVAVKDKDGKEIPADGLKALTEDTTYTIEVTVAPKTEGSPDGGTPATVKTGTSNSANINVFKPELTFKDSEAKYGETVSDDFSANKVGEEKWKHNSVESGSILGTKPNLVLTYTPDSTKILNGKYTNQDVPVKVTVKIGNTDVTENTTFVHQPCSPDCGWVTPSTPGDPAFKVHITTCSLTITKTGRELIDEKQSFIFNVRGIKNDINLDVVIAIGDNEKSGSITINDLPIGEYTVTEKTSWSWRYTPDAASKDVNLKEDNTVEFVNTRAKTLWLNGCAYTENRFGTPSKH